MTTLTEWAVRHGVSPAAIDELAALIKHDTPDKPPSGQPAGSEQYAQQAVRVEASEAGCRLWRNNVGAIDGHVVSKRDLKKFCPRCVEVILKSINERHIRYGLCNDSKAMNSKIKSSDLIGIRPVLVRPEHVGYTFGVFLAREMKHELWTYTGKPREVCQKSYLELVISMGGDASFATGKGTI